VIDEGLVEVVIRPNGQLRAQTGTAIIDGWSYPDYLDVRAGATGMAMTGWSRSEALVRLPDQTAPTSVPAMYVSSNYFSTVGVGLSRGRGFTAADDASVAPAEAVIGHRIWQLRFGADPDIIGRIVSINETEYVVVGVAPDSYRGHVGGLNDTQYSLWLPLSRHPRLTAAADARLDRSSGWVNIVARLANGVTVPQADAAVASVMSGLAVRYPSSNQDKIGGVEPYFPPGARRRTQVTFARMMLMGLSGMVLLVVGLNISGMMLVRSAIRERELAIRLAIGASRWRLARYHLSEALVIALFGGALASAVLFGVPVIVAWAYDLTGPELDPFKPDIWLFLQCVFLCFATAVILGLLPALRFSRPAILAVLKSDFARSGRRVGRLQRLTAAVQTGIAVPFLVIGGIRIDQARVTLMAELGFQPKGLYAARLNLDAIAKTDDDRRVFLRTVEDNLARAQAVHSVSLADGIPLDFKYRNARIAATESVAGAARESAEVDSTFVTAHSTRIGTGYLETVGIRLLAGRTIEANDRAGAERVVLLSEPLARQLFSNRDALGQRVTLAFSGEEQQTYTVVGVTADVVSTQMGNPRPQLFVALAQHPSSTVLAVVRGMPADPSVRRAFENTIADARRRISAPVSPTPGVNELQNRDFLTGEGLIEISHRDILTEGAASGVAAGVALVLAALGVYGVIAFMVATRTREIGVRVALGASRARVLRDVLGDALRLVVPGIGIGLLLAVLWVRVADPSWYPLGGVEPLVYAVAATVAFAVAAVAGIPSARRAASVEPMVAMRSE
jgi:putative ABC transport system permease protein